MLTILRVWVIASVFCLYVMLCRAIPPGQPSNSTTYKPTWESLDARPLPEWYDDAKFGIFMHWGVYSVPGFGSEWFWNNWKSDAAANYVEFMNKNYAPSFTYQTFGSDFRAQFFDAQEWAEILKGSGAKYVVLTSKHHEGFTLWPSSRAFSWNAMEVGPHRDLVGELAAAVRDEDMHFGVYYSLYEWFNPMYLADKKSIFHTQTYVFNKMLPEITELVNNYKPDVIWSDGDWEATDSYWKSKEFLAWLFNESPVKDTVVVNDRWGANIPCHHGGVYTCTDRYNPQTLQPHKWENCMTVDKVSWGYRRNAKLSDFLSIEELIKELTTTVSCGGNLLMNVGPTSDGIIAPIFQDRLHSIGEWLKINGEAIYKTKPWSYQNDTVNGDVWYTASKNASGACNGKVENGWSAVYAVILKWPQDNLLVVGSLASRLDKAKSTITLIGNQPTPLDWTSKERSVWITLPDLATVTSKWAWVLKICNVK